MIQALEEVGFIAESIDFQGEMHYRPGHEFLELMTFLGCSPVVSLGEPGLTGDDFCHIALLSEQAEPYFLHGKNIKPPRCPHCRQTENDWQSLIQKWTDNKKHPFTCPHCGQQSDITELKWRQSAGFLRSGIAVWGIYEGEAVPAEQLLNILQQQSGCPWKYFYLQS